MSTERDRLAELLHERWDPDHVGPIKDCTGCHNEADRLIAAGVTLPESDLPAQPDPTWAHTKDNDPSGLYDDQWEPV